MKFSIGFISFSDTNAPYKHILKEGEKMTRLCCAICCICLLLPLTLSGCVIFSVPPSVSSVDQRLRDNCSDIQIIVDFMVNSGYEDIYINDTSGKMLADLVWTDISDETVSTAVYRLLVNDAYQSISKIRSTIILRQWKGLQDIGCGIACSINALEMPEIEYMTELVPLSTEGWYYYVDDYNKWRVESGSTLEVFEHKHN